MATPPKYKYTLKDESGNYYYIDTNGNVATSSSLVYLDIDPKDWQNMQLKIGRDMTFFGLQKKYSLPITFVRNAAKILRSLWYADSSNAYCKLEVYKRNLYNWKHSIFYASELDFSTATDDGINFTINVLQESIVDTLHANQDKEYDIALSGAGLKTLKFDGVDLRAIDKYESIDYTSGDGQAQLPIMVPLTAIEHDGDFNAGNATSVIGHRPSGSSVGDVCFTVSQDFDGVINFNIPVHYNVNGTSADPVRLRMRIEIYADNTFATLVNAATRNVWTDVAYCAIGGSRDVVVSGTYNFSFSKNQVVYVFMYGDSALTGTDYINVQVKADGSQFVINESFKLSPTTAPAFRYFDFAEKIIEAASEGAATLRSSFLSDPTKLLYNCYPYRTMVTSGQALQGISNPVIKGKLSDMRKDLYRWGLGIGIEGTEVVIETLDYFFNQSNLITTITEIENLKISIASDLMGNVLDVGFQDPSGTSDTLNMPNEQNAQQEYSLPINRIKNTIDWISPYCASSYQIETIRKDYEVNNPNTSGDNTVILVYAKSAADADGNWHPQQYTTSEVLGVPSADSIYNVPLSPKRSVLNNLPYIKSITYPFAGKYITFESASKSSTMATVISPWAIGEGTNVDLSGFGSVNAIFKPYYAEFDADTPDDLFSLFDSNLNGYISFYDAKTKNYYSGFPIDIGVNVSYHKPYYIKLLITNSTNITNLIQ